MKVKFIQNMNLLQALQLANVKLMQDGHLHKDSAVNEKELIELATVLNQWIKPSRGDKDKARVYNYIYYRLDISKSVASQ